jgi:hypothetical protein
MSPRPARLTLVLALLSVPAVAAPPREDRHDARIRSTPVRPVAADAELPPSEAAPIAAAAADAGGVDLAGLLGMLTALAATYAYARGQRPSVAHSPARHSPSSLPPDPR